LRYSYATVVFCVNSDYLLPLTVAWQSLHDSNSAIVADLPIVVLADGIGPDQLDRLRRHADRLGLNVDVRPVELPDLPYNLAYGGTRANYGRLAIGAMFAGHSRVLYLDADLLILDDLRPLLDTDLRARPFGAVRDPVNPTYELGRALPGWQAFGIPGDREYFNSGVLLFDLQACAEADLFGRALHAVAEYPDRLRMWDQDALNLVAEDRWLRLPARWNTVPFSALRRTPWIRYRAQRLVPVDDLVAAERDAAVMHYVSPSKPWRGLLPNGPANDLYQRYLAAVSAAEPACVR
jgi:lipopolysaccharide biosynthesis glycosyltransferase